MAVRQEVWSPSHTPQSSRRALSQHTPAASSTPRQHSCLASMYLPAALQKPHLQLKVSRWVPQGYQSKSTGAEGHQAESATKQTLLAIKGNAHYYPSTDTTWWFRKPPAQCWAVGPDRAFSFSGSSL